MQSCDLPSKLYSLLRLSRCLQANNKVARDSGKSVAIILKPNNHNSTNKLFPVLLLLLSNMMPPIHSPSLKEKTNSLYIHKTRVISARYSMVWDAMRLKSFWKPKTTNLAKHEMNRILLRGSMLEKGIAFKAGRKGWKVCLVFIQQRSLPKKVIFSID